MDQPFTHLHLHTEFSMLDGSSKISELVARIKELGMDSVAITDHGVMHGVIDFYKECKKQGIHPVIGCEAYVAPRGRKSKENKYDASNYHLVLLAQNEVGYHNLMKLVSFGFLDGFYYKPRIDFELLEKYSEGLIALSACLGGHVSQLIMNNQMDEAKNIALRYRQIFGKENYYLELQKHGYEEEEKVNRVLTELSRELDIPLVVTNDSHYTYEEDVQAHDVLLCIQTNKKVSDTDRMRYLGGQFFVKSPKEMYELFPEYQEALENTHKIAMRCKVDFTFGEIKLPQFDVPEGYEASSYLREICEEGLKKRYKNYEEHRERLDYELQVIENMGYVDYFLIVWDFIKYARDHGIIVGPGRGSAAGSIVAYCLRITDIDPIRYQLLFERFLNPERVSMPDIDIDFCYERRSEVIEYVIQKYGAEKVAQIITFGTMAARAVIRDVGRAYDMSYADVDRVAKMIPNELKMTIDKALTMNKELAKLYEEDFQVQQLIDTSKRLEGLTRHSSIHAAGVVICDRPVYDYVPLNSNEESVTTQFPMGTLEELGLLKMDFLGLRTLTVIQDAVAAINQREDLIHKVDFDELDYDDAKTFELIASGKTEGVFQLESEGMKNFMKDLKPQNIEDIIAGISLYRPGPMSSIPDYVRGRHHAQEVRYLTKELEEILKPTYGCIVYQEQVMQIVRDLAGYTLGRSDLVRRAMSKKKADVMNTERQNFIYGNEKEGIKGCVGNGIAVEAAEKIFNDMEDFAKYAFNKSHAAAYAIVAYQTAWLKCYYPVEFMAALITSVLGNPAKTAEYVSHLREMGIDLLPPDINEGFSRFTVKSNKIRFGLAAIKNVGKPIIDHMVAERQKNGPFLSMTDFCIRMEGKDVNKRVLESLIKAGAFDSLGATRLQYMQGYKNILDSVSMGKKNTIEGQLDLFALGQVEEEQGVEDHLPLVGEFQEEQLFANEKEVLGIYVSGHPLMKYEQYLAKKVSHRSYDFKAKEEAQEDEIEGVGEVKKDLFDGQKTIIGGLIRTITRKLTRQNANMAFVEMEDMFGTVELVVFPKVYEKYANLISEDRKIIVQGRVNVIEDQDAKVIVEQIKEFEEIEKGEEVCGEGSVWLRFKNQNDFESKFPSLQRLLYDVEIGKQEIIYYIEEGRKKKSEAASYRVTRRILEGFIQILGEESVKIVEKS